MKKSNREKNRYIRELVIMAIVLAAVGLTVSYAAVNATLDIAGVTVARVASWNVKFTSTEVVKKTGSAEVVQEPKIRGLNIHYEVHLEEPGDSVTIKSVVKNDGTLNAKLESYDIFGVPSQYQSNVSYKVSDENGEPLAKNTVLKGGNAKEGKYMTVYITVTYEDYIYEGEGYKTFNLGLGLNFIQDCNNCS